ncbi:hypothetical protein H4R99_005197 [Coemansia sp. RSA 1722]|nr:hypothetical protein IWW45_004276 [Coemansia sp. RSA 485]KAJ2595795.1 hypothetical protein H4R99_005197 [Coemansia sp. RSA 1722]
MEVVSKLPPLPGIAQGDAVTGGITNTPATGSQAKLGCTNSPALLYRYTARILEIRNLATVAIDLPEALATLSAAQLQSDPEEEPEIVHAKPVYINKTTRFMLFLRDKLRKTTKVCVFDPFTLLIHPISVNMHHRARSLSVSAPLSAGSGTTTEWEYSVVCFGFSGGRAMIGNLSIGVDGAQISALEKLSLEGHKSDVVSSLSCELPGDHGRSLVFLGLASGHVAVVEYLSYGINRKHVVGIVPIEKPELGPASLLSAKIISNSRVVLAVGHSASKTKHISESEGSVSAVAVHTISLKGDRRSPLRMDTALVSTAPIQIIVDDQYNSAREVCKRSFPDAEIADLAVVSTGSAVSQQNVYVAALANAMADGSAAGRGSAIDCISGAGNGSLSNVFNAWAVSGSTMKLSSFIFHDALSSGRAIGMQISGAAGQVDIVANKQVLYGDALVQDLVETDIGTVSGSGLHDDGLVDLGRYADLESKFVYSDHICNALMEQRRRMDGELFIDLLLRMAGAADSNASMEYPPKGPADICSFIRGICNSALDDLKQRCIVYYLMLDLSAPALVSESGIYTELGNDVTSQSEEAARYACVNFIPRHFEYLMRGYWLMDHAQTAAGISFLADPSVVADWAPKILRTAVSAGCYAEADVFLNSATALMQPRLEEQLSEAPVIMEVLLHCDFDRAFFFQRLRSASPDLRDALLTQLFVFSLSPHARRHAVDRLSMLPLDATEESALERYCTLPDATAHVRDFLALYFVNRGRYAEAIRLFRQTAKLEASTAPGPAQKRKSEERLAMVQNLMLLLPAAQRWVIDELESLPSPEHGCVFEQHLASTLNQGKAEVESEALGPVGDRMAYKSGTAMEMEDAAWRNRQQAVPLSASKVSRQLVPVVGANGAPQNASQTLLRVLINQMAVTKPATLSRRTVASPERMRPSLLVSDEDSLMIGSDDLLATPRAKTGSAVTQTPWKTPFTSFPNRSMHASQSPLETSQSPSARLPNALGSAAARVPFSGPPSTPHTPAVAELSVASASRPAASSSRAGNGERGRDILAKAAAVDAPPSFLSKNDASSSSVEMDSGSLSPFAKIRQRTATLTKDQQSVPSTPKNLSAKQKATSGIESSAHRYNLRHRTGVSGEEAETVETAAHASGGDDDMVTSSNTADPPAAAKDKKKSKKTAGPDAQAKEGRKKRSSKSRAKKAKEASKNQSATAADQSSRSFERAVGKTAEDVSPRQSSRIRKRTEQQGKA